MTKDMRSPTLKFRLGPFLCAHKAPQSPLTRPVSGSIVIPLHPSLEALHFNNSPGGSAGKESAFNAGDLGSIPGLGRSPGEGKGYPLQCSCLQNSMDRGAWWATSPWACKELDAAEQLTLSL